MDLGSGGVESGGEAPRIAVCRVSGGRRVRLTRRVCGGRRGSLTRRKRGGRRCRQRGEAAGAPRVDLLVAVVASAGGTVAAERIHKVCRGSATADKGWGSASAAAAKGSGSKGEGDREARVQRLQRETAAAEMGIGKSSHGIRVGSGPAAAFIPAGRHSVFSGGLAGPNISAAVHFTCTGERPNGPNFFGLACQLNGALNDVSHLLLCVWASTPSAQCYGLTDMYII
jgi:hypothetical protein